MPRARNLSSYPTRYAEIIQQCAIRNISQRLAFRPEEKRKALSMRGHFYAYVGVLKAEGRRIEGLNSRSRGEADILELAKQVEMVMLTVTEESNGIMVLEWQNREYSWQALALKRIIPVEKDGKPEVVELSGVEDRLMQIQREIEE